MKQRIVEMVESLHPMSDSSIDNNKLWIIDRDYLAKVKPFELNKKL